MNTLLLLLPLSLLLLLSLLCARGEEGEEGRKTRLKGDDGDLTLPISFFLPFFSLPSFPSPPPPPPPPPAPWLAHRWRSLHQAHVSYKGVAGWVCGPRQVQGTAGYSLRVVLNPARQTVTPSLPPFTTNTNTDTNTNTNTNTNISLILC